MGRLLANSLVLALILLAIGFLGTLGILNIEGGMLLLFLCFFATITTVFAVPALVLLGYHLKEICRLAWQGRRGEVKGK